MMKGVMKNRAAPYSPSASTLTPTLIKAIRTPAPIPRSAVFRRLTLDGLTGDHCKLACRLGSRPRTTIVIRLNRGSTKSVPSQGERPASTARRVDMETPIHKKGSAQTIMSASKAWLPWPNRRSRLVNSGLKNSSGVSRCWSADHTMAASPAYLSANRASPDNQ